MQQQNDILIFVVVLDESTNVSSLQGELDLTCYELGLHQIARYCPASLS